MDAYEQTCRQCTARIPLSAAFCPHCGFRAGGLARGPEPLQVLGAVVMGLFALPLIFGGGCALLIGVFSTEPGVVAVGAAVAAAGLFLIYRMVMALT